MSDEAQGGNGGERAGTESVRLGFEVTTRNGQVVAIRAIGWPDNEVLGRGIYALGGKALDHFYEQVRQQQHPSIIVPGTQLPPGFNPKGN